jgi:hypothetical protein
MAFEILADCQFTTTGPAQNRLLLEFGTAPDTSSVASFRLMAKETGIIAPATGELDRHDIERTPIMSTPRT